jgi:glycosyltransferase involved in cell wall biosynthesis
MIIPRKDNYFNRCKSNIKFLEAAMCEIPVVAQSFSEGPYEEITEDMGILVRDNKKWDDMVNLLIADKHLRRKMGRKAKEYALKHYDINNRYHLWNDAYVKTYEQTQT